MTEERKRDFDSCTRHELTECVKYRIKVIREIRLAKVEVAFKFPNVHTFLMLKENAASIRNQDIVENATSYERTKLASLERCL